MKTFDFCRRDGKWYWKPIWVNNITYEKLGYKRYRWGYWEIRIFTK